MTVLTQTGSKSVRRITVCLWCPQSVDRSPTHTYDLCDLCDISQVNVCLLVAHMFATYNTHTGVEIRINTLLHSSPFNLIIL